MSIDTYGHLQKTLTDVIAETEDPAVKQDHSTYASRVGQTGLLVAEYKAATDGEVEGTPISFATLPADAIITGDIIVQTTADVEATTTATVGLGAISIDLGGAAGDVASVPVDDADKRSAADREITIVSTGTDAGVACTVLVPHVIGMAEPEA